MKRWFFLRVLSPLMIGSILFGFTSQLAAEELTPAQQEAVQKAVQEYLKEKGYTDSGMPPAGPGGPTAPRKTRERSLEQLSKPKSAGEKYGSTMEGSGKLIYARPFVSSPKAILGGYFDFEYWNKKNDGKNSYFDQHRLVPFIYGDISEHVKFAAEIEIEHGAGKSGGRTDMKVEFATMDYLVSEPVNFRAGILLLPLGKFNLLHDAPLRDLTERPLVAQRIIPSTLHQPGVGMYGTFYPTSLSQLNYELYVTSGYTNAFGNSNDPTATSNINTSNGLRSARTNDTRFDNNQGKALVGRIAFSPILGVELGGSGFGGTYDKNGDRMLYVWALDWTFQRGPFEVIGESAWSYIENNNLQQGTNTPVASTTNSERMWGYYIQGNYHFLPQWLTNLAPSHFRQEISTLTAVVRWEEMNLGASLDDSTEDGKSGERQRATFGLNFRPTEDSVIKLDYQYSPKDFAGGRRIHDSGFVGSVATYF